MFRKILLTSIAVIACLSIAVGCAPQAAPAAPAAPAATTAPAAPAKKTYTIAIIHQQEGNPYFAVEQPGVEAAAKELGDTVIFKGPASMDVNAQVELVDSLIAQKVDAIGLDALDPDALVPVAQKAMKAGIKVFSWDSALAPAGRLLHFDAASPEDVGRTEVQMMARTINYEGQIAILSAGSTNLNSNLWNKWSEEELKDPKYSKMTLVKTVYGDDDYQKGYNLTQALLKEFPNLKGIIGPTTVGIATASKYIKDAGLVGKVFTSGLGLPSEMKEYIQLGICKEMALWSPIDQGYGTVYIAHGLLTGEITPKAGETLNAGRLGKLPVVDTGSGNLVIYQGKPMIFDQSNIDKWAAIF